MDKPEDQITKATIGDRATARTFKNQELRAIREDANKVVVTKDNFDEYFRPQGTATKQNSDEVGEYYRLTPNQFNQLGSISTKISLDLNRSFDLKLKINVGNKDGASGGLSKGGDGIGFFLSPSDVIHSSSGRGASLGMGGLSNSFGFKIDTYRNTTKKLFPLGTNKIDDYTVKDPDDILPPVTVAPGASSKNNTGTFGAFYFSRENDDIRTFDTSSAPAESKPRWVVFRPGDKSKYNDGKAFEDFELEYDAGTTTLTATYQGQTWQRDVSDWIGNFKKSRPTLRAYLHIAASTGGATNDQGVKFDEFTYYTNPTITRRFVNKDTNTEALPAEVYSARAGIVLDPVDQQEQFANRGYELERVEHLIRRNNGNVEPIPGGFTDVTFDNQPQLQIYYLKDVQAPRLEENEIQRTVRPGAPVTISVTENSNDPIRIVDGKGQAIKTIRKVEPGVFEVDLPTSGEPIGPSRPLTYTITDATGNESRLILNLTVEDPVDPEKRQNAREEAEKIEGLGEEEKARLIDQIDKAPNIEEIDDALQEARQAAETRQALEEAQANANDELGSLGNLSDTEREEIADAIAGATTPEAVKVIINSAQLLDKLAEENAAKREELLAEAREAINKFPYLTDEERDQFIAELENAETPDELDAIVADADEASLDNYIKEIQRVANEGDGKDGDTGDTTENDEGTDGDELDQSIADLLKGLVDELARLEQDEEARREALAKIQDQLAKLQDPQDAQEFIDRLEKELARLDEGEEGRRNALAKIQDQLAKLQGQQAAQDYIDWLEKEIAGLKEGENGRRNALAKIQDQLAKLKDQQATPEDEDDNNALVPGANGPGNNNGAGNQGNGAASEGTENDGTVAGDNTTSDGETVATTTVSAAPADTVVVNRETAEAARTSADGGQAQVAEEKNTSGIQATTSLPQTGFSAAALGLGVMLTGVGSAFAFKKRK